MRRAAFYSLLIAALAGPLTLTPDRVPPPALSVTAPARSPLVRPGGELTYDVRLAANVDLSDPTFTLSAALPPGLSYVAGSTQLNSRPAQDPAVSGTALRWSGLPTPGDQPGRYGIHTLVQDIMDLPHINAQLDWARALGGPGSYVKELLYPITPSTQGPQQSWTDFVTAAYARDLIPVLRLQGVYNPKATRWEKPPVDKNGGYSSIAEAFKRVVAGLPRRSGHPLYVEIWNEPNLDFEWGGANNPVEYARFLKAVSDAIRSLKDPDIVIMNGGLSPGGNYPHLEFLDAMFRAVPDAVNAFDVWASHPYAGNHPPNYNDSYYSIRGYQWELSRLAQYRDVRNLKVMITEAGYALGNRDDPRYPAIDETNRAAYTREAFENYWSRDDRVLAVMPFELSAPFNDWPAWDWVFSSSSTRGDGSPDQAHPVYETVRNLPRQAPTLVLTFKLSAPRLEGSYRPELTVSTSAGKLSAKAEAVTVTDLSPAGVVSGQVVAKDRRPPAGTTVTIGGHSVATSADGSYQLAVPPGIYTLTVASPGCRPVQLGPLTVPANARTTPPEITLYPYSGSALPDRQTP